MFQEGYICCADKVNVWNHILFHCIPSCRVVLRHTAPNYTSYCKSRAMRSHIVLRIVLHHDTFH